MLQVRPNILELQLQGKRKVNPHYLESYRTALQVAHSRPGPAPAAASCAADPAHHCLGGNLRARSTLPQACVWQSDTAAATCFPAAICRTPSSSTRHHMASQAPVLLQFTRRPPMPTDFPALQAALLLQFTRRGTAPGRASALALGRHPAVRSILAAEG